MKNINMFPKPKRRFSLKAKPRRSNDLVKTGVNAIVGIAVLGATLGALKSVK